MTAAHTSPSATARPDGREWVVEQAAGEADAYYLVRLWHHYFGAEYTPSRLPTPLAEVAGWHDAADREHVPAYGVVARHSARARDASVRVGGGLAVVMDHDAAVDELAHPACRFDPAALVPESGAAWLWFGVVDLAWRGHGIGRELFRRRVAWAREQGVGVVLATGWERRDGRTSRPLFEAFGFQPLQRIEGYYADCDSRSSCPDCGVWPSDDDACECAATVWALDLPGDAECRDA